MERWQRREKKLTARKRLMPKHGRSVQVLQRLINDRVRRAKQ